MVIQTYFSVVRVSPSAAEVFVSIFHVFEAEIPNAISNFKTVDMVIFARF